MSCIGCYGKARVVSSICDGHSWLLWLWPISNDVIVVFSGSKLDTLYQLANGMEGVDTTPYVLQTKLQIAAMILFGLSHFHNVAVDGMVLELWQKIDPQPLRITISIQGMSS